MDIPFTDFSLNRWIELMNDHPEAPPVRFIPIYFRTNECTSSEKYIPVSHWFRLSAMGLSTSLLSPTELIPIISQRMASHKHGWLLVVSMIITDSLPNLLLAAWIATGQWEEDFFGLPQVFACSAVQKGFQNAICITEPPFEPVVVEILLLHLHSNEV